MNNAAVSEAEKMVTWFGWRSVLYIYLANVRVVGILLIVRESSASVRYCERFTATPQTSQQQQQQQIGHRLYNHGEYRISARSYYL